MRHEHPLSPIALPSSLLTLCVELPPLVVEAVRHLVAHHRTKGAEVDRRVGRGVKEGGLEGKEGEDGGLGNQKRGWDAKGTAPKEPKLTASSAEGLKKGD